MFDVKKLENVYIHQWLWLHMWETFWCNKPAIVGNKPRQTHSNSTRPWLDLFMHLETLLCYLYFSCFVPFQTATSHVFFCVATVETMWSRDGIKHLLTSVSNITWFWMIWCYCTSFTVFRTDRADSWGAHSWISSMKETLPLSGWCNMLASLLELCWPKLWWFARFILSWTI